MRIAALLCIAFVGSVSCFASPAFARAPVRPTSSASPPTALNGVDGIEAPVPNEGLQLTVQDINAWLDGYMPYALESGDIAGAMVVVVRDGRVLTERGYGFADLKSRKPVDPASTLFRTG